MLPSQRDELVKVCAPVLAVTRLFHAKTVEEMTSLAVPEEWPVALAFAKKSRARIAIYRIEHLAAAKERGERLGALMDAEVPLYVHTDWPPAPDLRWLADYSDALCLAKDRDQAVKSREGLKGAAANGVLVGRPLLCSCEHEKNAHDNGVGPCGVEGCSCTAYAPASTVVTR